MKTFSHVLIVKLSSLGDIVQAFSVLAILKRQNASMQIDWVVEKRFASIIDAHPLIDRTISIDLKKGKNFLFDIKALRETKYDLLFDLQANCKSALITFFAKALTKVGYDHTSSREWPNIFATHKRFFISKEQNICSFYQKLITTFFQTSQRAEDPVALFRLEKEEREKLEGIQSQLLFKKQVMVCPGSKWENKRLDPQTLISLLQKIEMKYCVGFVLVWGDKEDQELCFKIKASLKEAMILERLSLPLWQNVMAIVDLVFAMDSSALHLCATTATPSFSVFGPTSKKVFKPLGSKHTGLQGSCPYGKTFLKQCPLLRSCKTGACMKNFTAEELFQAFESQCDSLLPQLLVQS